MEHEGSVDPDIERLREKTQQGTLNVVNKVLADPKVQEVIKTALLRETIKNSLVMACLFVGMLKLYDVAKVVFGFGWTTELVISVVLILTGLIYLFKNIISGKKLVDPKTNSGYSHVS